MHKTLILLLVGAAGVLSTAVGGNCPPAGPVLPPPKYPAKFDPQKLSSKIDSLLKSPKTTWNVSTTSFSVELTSTDATLFEYHHTAAVKNASGVKTVDTDTVYRIMSVTKTVNVLALLLNAAHKLDTPIGDYVEELRGFAPYKDVTLRMLASQMAGVPNKELEKAGFPTPDPKDIPTCDNLSMKLCSRKEMLDALKKNKLVFMPGDKPAYSDQAYMLLGWAMENITGKPFEQILHDSITGPLGLSAMGLQLPDLSKGAIPVGIGASFFAQDLGNFNYTPRNLTAYTRAILNSTLLTPAQTRMWLKPSSFAGSFAMYIGAPWEIFRLPGLTPDGRPIDVYTKSGSMPGLASYIFIIPDYNIGGTIAVAGTDANSPAFDLLDAVTEAVVREADGLARKQAEKTYAGRYTGSNSSSLELVVDKGPGLRIKSWTRTGKSILAVLADQKGADTNQLDARIYPIGEDGRWRMVLEKVGKKSATPSRPSEACANWFNYDTWRYAGLPVDEFDFDVSEQGVVRSISNPGLRSTMAKK
ncbi:beta-lactamase [Purpureocillium lavendulum]|uniref:Beta-lactamase n=1 Tax=Purpureocillium lavendulum TaxID=1247861 RepID=A0AB34FYN0_9HYPO|nr:beta-lactamase [Purpureocillium lavendulum]